MRSSACDVENQLAGGLSARSYRGSGSCSFTDGRRDGAAGHDGTKVRDELHDLAGCHFRPWRREDVELDGGREERGPGPDAGGANSAAPTVQSGGKPMKVAKDCPPDSKAK